MEINLAQIMEGHMKEFLNLEEKLSKERMEICKVCPLYIHTRVGYICNNELWLDPLNNVTSEHAKHGYVRGCKCRLEAKTRIKDAKCPANKW